MSERNGTSEIENGRRLDQMEDVIQSRITLVLERDKADEARHQRVIIEMREQHAGHIAELQSLIALQKEQRIDIMALLQLQKKSAAPPSCQPE